MYNFFNWKLPNVISDDLNELNSDLSKISKISKNYRKNAIKCNMKIKDRPIAILNIDGGGIKGYVSAYILLKIEERCGIPLNRLFDIIGGVSSGSLSAFHAAYADPLTFDYYTEYSNILENARKLFSKRSIFRLIRLGYMCDLDDSYALSQKSTLYLSSLKNYFRPIHKNNKPHVSHCCAIALKHSSSGQWNNYVLRNYNLPENTDLTTITDGSSDWSIDKILLATCAAPILFPCILHDNDKFIDGAVRSCSHVNLIIDEAKVLWPKKDIGLILSIGFDYLSEYDSNTKINHLYWLYNLFSVINCAYFLHNEMLRYYVPQIKNSNNNVEPLYIRIQVPVTDINIYESNINVINKIKMQVNDWISKNEAVFDELVSYFEKYGIIEEEEEEEEKEQEQEQEQEQEHEEEQDNDNKTN